MRRFRVLPAIRKPALRMAAALGGLAMLACAPAPAAGSAAPVTGRVVWESNRSGDYRIWMADLDGRGLRQVSPDEPGRDHCCASLSPDGTRLAYLSTPQERRRYLPPTTPSELRLLRFDGGAERTLSTTARHLGSHRAVVWWGPGVLTYLEADGSTRRLDLALGVTTVLLREPPDEPGWIVAPGGGWATTDEVSFSALDPASGRLRRETVLGGCEPTFSADGELGVWVAGAGGPIDVIELATRETRTLVRKNDSRLPRGWRYLYFPALSADRSLLAWAASDGEHDHFRADYDVFVTEIDPETLELTRPPRHIAPHPGVDRFPAVWRLAAARPQRPQADRRVRPETVAGAPAPVFLWTSATAANRRAPDADSEILSARGPAWTDRLGRMALAGGEFAAADASARRVADALAGTNSFTLALLVEPAALAGGGPLVALSRAPGARGLVVTQRGDQMELLLRAGRPGSGEPPIPLVRLGDSAPHHLALTFSPGRLAVYIDGAPVDRRVVAGDFFHWRIDALRFGGEPGSDARFRGSLSDVAIWDREMPAAEIAARAAAARARLAAAPPVPRRAATAKLAARSRVPTLESISPYRRALVVEEFERVKPLAGEVPERFRIARWALLDGAPAAAMRVAPGDTVRLELEPYEAQPQLDSVVLSDTLPASSGPLFFAVGLGDG